MFNRQLEEIIQQTFNKALEAGHAEFSSEHLLVNLIENPSVWRLLTIFDIDKDLLINKLRILIDKLPTNDSTKNGNPLPSIDLGSLLQELTRSALAASKKSIAPVDVVIEMVKTKSCLAGDFMRGLGLVYDSRLLRYVSFGIPPNRSGKRVVGLMVLNDDYSKLEHVLSVLINDFKLTDEEAMKLAQKIHNDGMGFLGYFDHETAHFLMRRINVYSTLKDQPLLVTLFEVGQKIPGLGVFSETPDEPKTSSYSNGE